MAVILSGTGTDGAAGLQEVREAGGITIVQEPSTARYDGMPSSAIATDLVDFILPPEQMPIYLINFLNQALPILGRQNEARRVEVDDALRHIFVLLQAHTGYDFSMYKEDTLRRRIERRVVVNQFSKVTDYLDYLQQNPLEVEMLFKELLIGVTNFFRDPEAMSELLETHLPELLLQAQNRELRFWVAGCSTGEEAYSLAILVNEQIAALGRKSSAKIFATDVHQSSLDIASAGIYPESALAGVSAARRQKYLEMGRDL